MRIFLLLVLIQVSLFGMNSSEMERIKAHIDQKFAEKKMLDDPFPYMVIEDLLPEDIYKKLLHYWPKSQKFNRIDRTARLYVTKGLVDYYSLTKKQTLFWKQFGDEVMPYVKEHVKVVCQEALVWKFPDLSKDELQQIVLKNSKEDSLVEFYQGYYIPLHIDFCYLFASLLFYCPEDNQHAHLATHFHVPVDNSYPKVRHYNGETRRVKSIPYKRNTLLILPQNEKQLHEAENSDDYTRRLYLSFIHIDHDSVERYYGGPPWNYTKERMEQIENSPVLWAEKKCVRQIKLVRPSG